MSWNQGVSGREEFPKGFIDWAEDFYYRSFNETAEFQYAVWFDLGNPITLDFGTGKVLDVDMDIRKFSYLVEKFRKPDSE